MRNYELTVILHPKHIEEGKQAFADIIQKHGVVIKKDEDWGNKRLAYPIDDQSEGFYLFKIVEAEPENITAITRDFQISQPILRSMFVVLEKETVKE